MNQTKTPLKVRINLGFTIVELLVVIVVIGILATITVVSYANVTKSANIAIMQSDLTSSSDQLKVYQAFYHSYPTALENNCPSLPKPDTALCLKPSPNNTLTYTSDGKTFSLIETNTNGMVYNITDSTKATISTITIATYTLTITAGNGGTVNTGGIYNSDTVTTITATPNANYLFSSWSGSTGCSGVASHTITIDDNKSCTANFTASGSPYIQTITAVSCPSTRTRAVDARDNHTYWVQKLADGKCWMLTNLGYFGGGTNTYSDTKTLTNGTGGSATYAIASYYVTPATTNFTTEPTAPSAATDGTGQYGYMYNWCAAMGAQLSSSGCSNTITTPLPVTTASICPSGWRLPTGNGGEFGALNAAINGGSTTTDAGLIDAPWLAQRGGGWFGGGFFDPIDGNYWSSTQYQATYAYYLTFSSTFAFPSQHASLKNWGFAVRCIAI